jgi:GT2 family glycosyltransferase/glycosyltransferase involved in cell wall biosynthesis
VKKTRVKSRSGKTILASTRAIAHFDRIGRLTTGWLVDPTADAAVDFVLVLDDISTPGRTVLPRPDVVQAGLSKQPLVGFTVDLSEAFTRWRLGGRPGRAPSRITIQLGDLAVLKRDLPDLSNVEGHLQVDTDAISGFVSGVAVAASDIEVEILIDGVLMTTVTADRLNPEEPVPTKSFHLPMPASPRFDRSYSVRARIMFSGKELGNSPQTARGAANTKLAFRAASRLTAEANPSVSVIIPICNAADALKECLESVVRNTTYPIRLILIDDASTDPRIDDILRSFTTSSCVTVCRHSTNIGYTGLINEGLRHAETDDVVLLNSDTLVGPRWLENLRFAAYSDHAIATVTPFSNNAGAFSAPDPHVSSDLPADQSFDRLARFVSQESGSLLPEVPTASGFCMYVKRSCIDEIGVFDADSFPRGYGEENDFCLRSLRAGWRHVVDDRTFVFHHRSASFGDQERAQLSERATHILDERYPEYGPLLRNFHANLDLTLGRFHVRRAMEAPKTRRGGERPRALTIISSETGGTPLTNTDLARGLLDSFEMFQLHSDRETLTLSAWRQDHFEPLLKRPIATQIQLAKHFSSAYDDAFAAILVEYSIEIVHIRHIAWHSLGLTTVCRILEIPVIFSFHDFYTICPNVKLLDESMRFCGGTCTRGQGPCVAELWNSSETPKLKHSWVHTWQLQTSAMLENVDAFVTTSETARDIISNSFSEISDRPFLVIPHGRDFGRYGRAAVVPRAGQALRLLIPGNLSEAKGAGLLARLKDIDTENLLEIHTLGRVVSILDRDDMVHHGPYAREDFIDIAEKIRPHFGLVLSLWPETHCHTLTELWAAGIPVLGLDTGAVGERIRRHGGGLAISDFTAEAIYEALRTASQKKSYHQLLAAVMNWQTDVSPKQTVGAMAARYRDLYLETMRARASL